MRISTDGRRAHTDTGLGWAEPGRAGARLDRPNPPLHTAASARSRHGVEPAALSLVGQLTHDAYLTNDVAREEQARSLSRLDPPQTVAHTVRSPAMGTRVSARPPADPVARRG